MDDGKGKLIQNDPPPPSDGKAAAGLGLGQVIILNQDKINDAAKLPSSQDEYASKIDSLHVQNYVDTDETTGANKSVKIGAEGLTQTPNKKECWQRFLGMGLMIIASVFFSLTSVIVKNLRGYSPANVATWNSFGGVVLPSTAILIYCQFVQKSKPFQPFYPPIFRRDKIKAYSSLFLRSFIGVCNLICQYTSLEYLSLPDMTVISFSSPVIVTFLAYCILREKFGLISILGVIITFIGVVIVTQPPFLTGSTKFDSRKMTGVGYALGSMVGSAFVFILLRMLKHVNFAVILLVLGSVGIFLSLILCSINASYMFPRSGLDLGLAICLCWSTFGGQVSMTLAFKLEDAGPLSLIRSFDVIFSFIWEFIFFKDEPNVYSLIGAIIVLSGVILIGLRKHVSSLPENHPCRKTCCILLK